ncbi:MAG: ATP-binding protein, partial [Nitrospirota bacterium]|nr:ATP-binding protein [Nitrospirota bacterium]
MNISEKNTLSLEHDLNWFARVLEARISLYFEQNCAFRSIYDIDAPDLEKDESEYAAVIKSFSLDIDA